MSSISETVSSSQYSLKNSWFSICSKSVELDLPTPKWKKYAWSCNEASAKRLYRGIAIQKPKFIVETGTFEGLGTFIMAKAAHENNNGAHIFTIDYDGDPNVQLPREDWLQLKGMANSNLKCNT